MGVSEKSLGQSVNMQNNKRMIFKLLATYKLQ